MTSVNSEFPLRDIGVSNSVDTAFLPRHRWYFVKEGFSPVFVERALETDGVQAGDLLVDPFSGGGTVSLTGALAGLRTEAYEVNPFLHFLSSAKLSATDALDVRSAGEAVSRSMAVPVQSSLEGYSTFTEGNRWKRWLFPLSVIRSFEAGKRAVAELDNPKHRALLKLALIGAAMDCCNATRDGKCLRFRNGWTGRQVTYARVRARFRLRVGEIAADLEKRPLRNVSASVVEGDAREKIGEGSERFRICVTSPPYLNSFDYSDIYRPELFLGGFVSSTEELMKIRLRTIRSHVQASWEMPRKDEFGILYQKCVTKLREVKDTLWDHRVPTMIQAYFEDMERVLKALRVRAQRNASMWLVVSTSAYAGIEVPVDLILAELGQRSGWFLREIGVLRYLRSSSQHVEHVGDKQRKSVPLRESVVIFDASMRA